MTNRGKYLSLNTDELRFENELKKLKIRAEFGMSMEGYLHLDPVREHEKLLELERYELEYEDFNQISVYGYIGTPNDITPLSKIPRLEIELELAHVQKLLASYGIWVESVCPVPGREMYRFILEDVFREQLPYFRKKGAVKRFVYEDYYPNAKHEIKTTLEGFLNNSFQGHWNLLEGQLSSRVQTIRRTSTVRKSMVGKLKNWVSAYQGLCLADIQFHKISVNESQASAAVCIHFSGEVTDKPIHENGEVFANFQLVHDGLGYWYISGVFIPQIR